jgi:lipopolysaccharide cholinephosphotransferase
MNRNIFINKKSNYLIRAEFMLCFFIVLFTIIGQYRLVSVSFTFSFIILLITLIQILLEYDIKKADLKNIILLALIVFLSLIAILNNSPIMPFSFDYYKKYFIFCSTVIFLFITSIVVINKKTYQFILVTNILIGVVYIYSYFFRPKVYYAGGLTLNFSNPNLTAMWILQTIFYLIITFLFCRKTYIRILLMIFIGFLIDLLIETRGRTSILALIAFISLAYYILIRRKIIIKKYLVTPVILFPIIVVLIYFFFIKTGIINYFGFIVSEGKSLYSREVIWSNALDAIKQNPFLGAYYIISNGTGKSQMHNSHLDIWASYGIFVFVSLMIYIIRIVKSLINYSISKIQIISLLAFFSVIMMGMGEAALFSGGQGIYILGCSFLLLAKHELGVSDTNNISRKDKQWNIRKKTKNVTEINLSKEDVEKLKKIQLEILKEFINICTELKLNYYAIGGTALGAIRHHGFIPWDDDIDICMPRPDYEIFINKGQKLLSTNLFIQTNVTDHDYPNNFAKIRDSSTTYIELTVKNINMNHGVFIDIFPIDGVCNNYFQRIIFKTINLIYTMRISRVFYMPKDKYNQSTKGKLFLIFSRIVTAPFSLKNIILKRDKLLKKYGFNSCETVANYCGAWGDKEIFPKHYFGSGAIMKFEGIEILVPEKYKLLLYDVYGDYMQLPPKEERIAHHYCTLIDLNKPYIHYMSNNKSK